MRLIDFVIDRFPQPAITARCGDCLTVIIEPNPMGRLAEWIGDCWFGAAPTNSFSRSPLAVDHVPTSEHGSLGVDLGGCLYRGTRSQPLCAANAGTAGPTAWPGQASVVGGAWGSVDRELFETFVCFSPASGVPSWSRIAELLRTRFAVSSWAMPAVPPLVGGGLATRPLGTRLDESSLTAQVESLTTLKDRLRNELAQDQSTQRARRLELEAKLHRVSEELERTRGARQIAALRREELDRRITELEKCAVRPADVSPTPGGEDRDALLLLYGRLEELDRQWHPWQAVQQAIQARRMALRQQAKSDNALSMDAPEHPYHRVRQLLHSLEQSLPTTAVSGSSPASVLEPRVAAPESGDVFPAIRQGLEAICAELREQYRHVRYRTTAAELKQLRTCFQEIDARLQEVASQRQQIVDALTRLDPAGAQLVLRPTEPFRRDAAAHGYLAARVRMSDTIPLPVAVGAPRVSQREALSLWNELEACRRDRARIQREIEQEETRERSLEREEGALQLELERTPNPRDAIEAQLDQLAAGIHRIHCELEYLNRRLAVPSTSVLPRLERVLSIASELLSRMTGGRVVRIDLSDDPAPALRLVSVEGQVSGVTAVTPGRQAQVRLALALAVLQVLREHGNELPSWMFEPLRSIDTADLAATLQVLLAETRQQQMVVVVADGAAAQAFSAGKPRIYELPRSVYTGAPPAAPFDPSVELSPRRNSPRREDLHGLTVSHLETGAEPLYRFPIERPGFQATRSAMFTERDSQGKPIHVDDTLATTHLFSSAELNALRHIGIEMVAELLRWEPDDLVHELRDLRVTAEIIDRWQACCWMLVCIPGLAADDARVLGECGILDPEQLDSMTGDHLMRRLADHVGETGVRERYRFDRINAWMRGLASTRPLWQRGNGYSRLAFRQPRGIQPRVSDRWARIRRMTLLEAAEHWSEWMEQDGETTALALGGSRPAAVPSTSAPPDDLANSTYTLQLHDPVGATPSIGPKTAELLQQIGIETVADLLARSAHETAQRLNQRRISAETVQLWQALARLVSSIPNLRAQDAQLLVACQVSDPARLAAEEPDVLYRRIETLIQSKEGTRVLRGSPAPDLNSVRRWIQAAQRCRQLTAA